MQLLDEDGTLQEEAHWGSMRRPDLPEVFGVEPEKCHGFLVEVPRAKITAKELTLVFDNGYVKKKSASTCANLTGRIPGCTAWPRRSWGRATAEKARIFCFSRASGAFWDICGRSQAPLRMLMDITKRNTVLRQRAEAPVGGGLLPGAAFFCSSASLQHAQGIPEGDGGFRAEAELRKLAALSCGWKSG